MEKTELYRKYRPSTFDEMVGNAIAIKSLKKELENGSHVFLFTGNAGCGKTTLARILANEVGAGELSTHEINSAENRGIDTAREIMEQMRYLPSDGDSVVWILDECFHKDTLVDTLRGRVKISEIAPSELIFNSDGVSRVNNVQKKKVSVNNLLILSTSYGQILTTCEHLFYTKYGFIKAKDLVKGDVLYDIQDLPDMWENFSDVSFNQFKNLRKSLCWVATQTERIIGETEEIIRRYENEKYESFDLPCVWEEFYDPSKRPSEILFDILRSYWTKAYNGSIKGIGMCDLWEKIQTEELRTQKDLFKRLLSCLDFCKIFWEEMPREKKGTNEIEQSVKKSLRIRKNEEYEDSEWNSAYLEWETWRQRTVYERADDIIQKIGGGLVFRASNKNKEKISISDELQGRYRESIFEACDRGGRSNTFDCKAKVAGREENKFVGTVRVEGVEIYQRGNNEKYFERYFTNKELNEGFVYLYDLEIDGSPTYYVNGILVHNCHQWTNPSQNSLLKALEDTPDHVYFCLCTTDPQKLIAPLKSRCSIINLSPLKDDEMLFLLRRTARAEKVKLSSEVYDRIIELAQGGSRKALKLLAKVIYLDNEEEMLESLKSESFIENEECKELCKALLRKGASLSSLVQVLKKIDISEPEKIRQSVMGYMNAVIMNGNACLEAVSALQAFSQADTYRNGKFALTIALLDTADLRG